MSKQDQAVASGAVAVQAAGSVVITEGMSGDEVANIVRAARGDLDSQFTPQAMDEMRRRVERLEDKIIASFAGGEGNPAALGDPDVQLALVDAKRSFARSGDEKLGDTLAKILVERSLCKDRDRVALTLNRAVEVTPNLAPQDLSVLSLAFLLLNSQNPGVVNRAAFIEYYRTHLQPFVADVADAEGSLNYLQATSCLALTQFAAATLEHRILSHYGGLFSKGFERDQFEARVGLLAKGQIVAQHLVPSTENPKWLQFNFRSVTLMLSVGPAGDRQGNHRSRREPRYRVTVGRR